VRAVRVKVAVPLATGCEIRRWRQDAGLSLTALGLRAGVSHRRLGRIERGRIPVLPAELAALRVVLSVG
jgi:transcriptional regulator with XRE-family HTH domain